MNCCTADTNGCLDLRRRAFALNGQVSAEWRRCPVSMARRARDSVTPLWRSSAGWMLVENGKVVHWCRVQASSHNLQGVVDGGLIKRVWALWHQTGAQYSAVECTSARVAVRNFAAPAPQLEPTSHLRSATCDVSFLRNNSRCRQYVSDLSNVTLQDI